MKNILLLLIALFVASTALSSIATAETGTLRIQAGTTASNYNSASTNTDPGVEWDKILIDSNNYTSISHLFVVLSTLTFVNQSNTTQFTFTSGASGSGGTATYSKADNRIDWYFASDTIITGSTIILSYNTNIFSGVACQANDVNHKSTSPVTSTKPAFFKHSVSGAWVGCLGTLASYTADMSTTFENDYTVTYSPVADGLLSSVSVDKSMSTTLSKVNITNSTALKYYETVFNNINYEFSFLYDTGIALEMTDSLGNSDFVVVNSTAYTGAGAPTGENFPSDNVLNGVGLVWEFDTYSLDDVGNISWSKTTPVLACDNIKIYNPENTLKATISNPNDTGTYKLPLDSSGSWKAEYKRQSICLISSEEILNTAYTTVNDIQPSYLIINATTIAGKQENVTYRSDTIAPFAAQLRVIDAFGNPEGSFSIDNYQRGVEGTSPVVIITSGQHTIRLCSALGCDSVVAVTNTVFNTSIPTVNITMSNITMDNTVYSFEDHAIVTYAVDSYNFSNKAIYTTSFNWNNGIETTRYVGIVNQTGSYEEHLSLFRGRYTYPGDYTYRLMGRNDSGAFELAFWNFSILSIDAEGYGLSLSKDTLCKGESITFVVNSPTTSYLNVTLNTDGNVFQSYNVNMNKSITYKPPASGTYSVILYSPEGYTKRSFTFDVNPCIVPTTTTIPTAGQKTAEITGVLVSNLFWALVFTVGIMGFIGVKTRDGLPTAIAGMTSLGVFTWMTWIPPALFFSVLVIAAAVYLAPGIAAKILNIGGPQK